MTNTKYVHHCWNAMMGDNRFFFSMMGIMFCACTAMTAGGHWESLAVSYVIRCQEYHHLASLKPCPVDTHSHTHKRIMKLLQGPSQLSTTSWRRHPGTVPPTHTHANTKLVQMDPRSANPKRPLWTHDDRFMLTRRALVLDQVARHIERLWETLYSQMTAYLQGPQPPTKHHFDKAP